MSRTLQLFARHAHTSAPTPAVAGLRCALALALLATGSPAAWAASAAVAAPPTELVYQGHFSRESIDALKAQHAAMVPRPQWLVVDSGGGDVMLGMELGELVAELGLGVRVRHVCMSSCANYVFVAGRQRHIEPGAVVAWHGSALQANFMDPTQLENDFRAMVATQTALSEEERAKLLAEILPQVPALIAGVRKRQRALFQRAGVDECITVIGQITGKAQNFWFLSLADMARFGLRDVQAQADYLATDVSALQAKTSVVPLVLNDADLARCADLPR